MKKLSDTLIKILSLGIGLAIGIVLIAKVCFELSYDSFYKDADRIYLIKENIIMQEGDEPAEDPKALLKELDALLDRLEWLITRINLTNSSVLSEGKTMTELLARRDCLSKRLNVMRSFLDSASEKIDRYSQKEIKILSTVKVSTLQKQVDADSKALRELDERIQGLNWTTELLES